MSSTAARPLPTLLQLIVPVYGLYSRREGGWLSVATLIGLLADLGVDESAVRSSISRLKRRGILEAIRRDGTAGYELSDQALAILREVTTGSSSASAAPADGWLLAVFSVPEAERHKRHVLRSQLTRLGFGRRRPGCGSRQPICENRPKRCCGAWNSTRGPLPS
jgi:phenylacetic acid degradation operon negative regulatory protein